MKGSFGLIPFLILITISASSERLTHPWRCPGVSPEQRWYYEKRWKRMERNSNRGRDIERSMNRFSSSFQRYCKSQSSIRNFQRQRQKLLRKHWNRKINFFKKEVERVSRYEFPADELRELERWGRKAGKTREQIIPEARLKKLLSNDREKRESIKNSCTNQDNFKPPLKDTVRDQDGMGWCYAYVAADLLSHKLGKLVSSVDVFNTYNNANNPRKWFRNKQSIRQGGFTKAAIRRAVKKGICIESNVSSSDFAFQRSGTLSAEIKDMETAFKRYKRSLANAPQSKRDEDERLEVICHIISDDLRRIFNLTNEEMIESLKKAGPEGVINDMVEKNCNDKRQVVEGINVVSKYSFFNIPRSSDDLIEKIDQQLDRDNIVGFAYDSSLLRFPHKSEGLPTHMSSIVARRFDEGSGSCQYLIRNSWGSQLWWLLFREIRM